MVIRNNTSVTLFLEGTREGTQIVTPFHNIEPGKVFMCTDMHIYNIFSDIGGCAIEDSRSLGVGIIYRNFGKILATRSVGPYDGSLYLIINEKNN